MITLCSASIDWSATGTWVTGIATFLIACFALNSWKSQIKHQDKYTKVDALLEAFVNCVRAGESWQWQAGMGDDRNLLSENDKSIYWRDALMQYRMDWYKIKFHLSDVSDDLWFEPNKLQNEIIQIGTSLHHSNAVKFFEDMLTLLNKGLKDISNIKK
jgi:hypothetical protein